MSRLHGLICFSLLIWTMRTTYASLLNVKYLSNLITGRAFICSFQYPAYAIRYWYFLVTFFLAIALTFTTLARFLTHRKTRFAHFSFVIPTLALYLYMLVILTIPFSWLIQYINNMGFTYSLSPRAAYLTHNRGPRRASGLK